VLVVLCIVITKFYSKIVRVRRSFTLFPTEFYSFSDGVAFWQRKEQDFEDLALKTWNMY